MQSDRLLTYCIAAIFVLALVAMLCVYKALRVMDRWRPRFIPPSPLPPARPVVPSQHRAAVPPPPAYSAGRAPRSDAPTEQMPRVREGRLGFEVAL